MPMDAAKISAQSPKPLCPFGHSRAKTLPGGSGAAYEGRTKNKRRSGLKGFEFESAAIDRMGP
jgi:hypothetical protein